MKIRVVEESIWSCKEAAWDVDDFEVKISKVKQPLGLVAVEVLDLMEVCQVLMVSEDLDGEGGSMEVVLLGLQGADDCEELLVINVIILFS